MVVEINQDSVKYSYNQIKKQLNAYICPTTSLTIMINHNKKVEITGDKLVEYLITNLQRRQILELLEILKIIQNRNSETINYLHYILQGILPNVELAEQR
jgi:hypothetical protein